MAGEEKKFAKQLMGKTVVTKTGKKLGEIGNLSFETRTGELIELILRNPTAFIHGLDLEKKEGDFMIPYGAVVAVGDFIVVSEEDII